MAGCQTWPAGKVPVMLCGEPMPFEWALALLALLAVVFIWVGVLIWMDRGK